MRAFKTILLTGTAVLALMACASEGPGEIGSIDDIVVRNAGDKSAPPPPDAVKTVELNQPAAEAAASAETAAGDEPSAAEVIAAPDTGKASEAARAEAAEQVQENAAQVMEETEEGTAVREQITEVEVNEVKATPADEATAAAAPAAAIEWNQGERAAVKETAPAQTPAQNDGAAAPASTVEPAQPVPAAPPAADQQQAEQTMLEQSEAYRAAPKAPPVPAAAAEPAPVELTRVDGPVPFDPAILQSKDPAKIKGLQKALKDDGYYKGPIDGVMTSDTLNAYVKYQTAANAAAGVPAPQPQQQPAPAPEPVAQVQQVAPAPVMDRAPATETVAAPQAATTAPTPVAESATSVAPAPLMVSRRAPEPLPAVEPYKPSTTRVSSATPKAPAPVAAPAPAADTPPAVPAPAVESVAPVFKASSVSLNDPAVISAAQKALSAKGLYTGPVTGTVDAATLNAVIRYQSANNLTPGLLNVDTLKSLGVVTE